MKIILKIIVAVIMCASFICLFAISDDAVNQIIWSTCSLAVFSLSAKLFYHLCKDDIKNKEV